MYSHFNEEADYGKRGLDAREDKLVNERNDMLTKMVQANSAYVRETERRVREEVAKEKRIVVGKDKGVQWSPPKVQTTKAEVQTEVEEKGVGVLQETMEEKKRKREKKGKRAKDSLPAGGALPAIQEDTEMKDGSASSDGYEDLSGCEKEEDEATVTLRPKYA